MPCATASTGKGVERRGLDKLGGRAPRARLELALSLSYNSLRHARVTAFGVCLKIMRATLNTADEWKAVLANSHTVLANSHTVSANSQFSHSFSQFSHSFSQFSHSFSQFSQSFSQFSHSFSQFSHSFSQFSHSFSQFSHSFRQFFHSFGQLAHAISQNSQFPKNMIILLQT